MESWRGFSAGWMSTLRRDEMANLCPDCRKPLRTENHFGVNLDVCPLCAGIWFDEGELGRVLHGGSAALVDLDEELVPEIHHKPELESRRECPVCRQPLSRYHYLYSSPIELDACAACNGFWVDDGELNKIQE